MQFPGNSNYLSFQNIPHLCMQIIDVGLCVAVNWFVLDYQVPLTTHNPG